MISGAAPSALFNRRTILSLILGFVIWLALDLWQKMPLGTSSLLIMCIVMFLSNQSEQKHLAVYGGMIGVPAGWIYGLQSLPATSTFGFVNVIGGFIIIEFLTLFWMISFVLAGLSIGSAVNLYRKGAIF